MSCAICNLRKEKRFCPALHGKICPQCCGEQREVTLDCPSDCSYLRQSRQHASGHAAPLTEADRQAMMPEVEIEERFLYQREELMLGLSFALARCARADRSLTDRDLLAALGSTAKSYQTLVNSNLIYEQPTANVAHQSLAREIESMVREFREAELKHLGASRLRDTEVLKALVFLLRMGMGQASGRPKSRAFVDFLFAQFPEKKSALTAPEDSASRIVIP